MEKKPRNNLAKEALQTLQHFHCFLEQQTQKVRLQDGCPFSSLTLAPFLPLLGAHHTAEGEPLLAAPAPGQCVQECDTGCCHSQALLVLPCSCFVFPLEPSIHDGECFHQLFRDRSREGGSPSQPEEMKDSCQLRQGGFAREHRGFHVYFARLVTLSCICHSSF